MNEKAPAVSIVMVAYNHAKYLRETMASVFAQTLTDFEVILIDNGSTDNSPQIIAELNDPRLVCIRQENLGLSLAYNVGIERARGRWIALGNADDTMMPEKLELQLKAAEAHNAGAVFSAAQLIDDDSKPVPDELAAQFPFSFEVLPRARMYEKFFFRTNFMCATSAFINAKQLADGGFDPSLIQLQDFDVWVRLIKRCGFVVLQDKLTGYRVRTDGNNLSLDKRNRARVLFELGFVYKRFFDGVDYAFFKEAFGKHFRRTEPSGAVGLEYEKAFLFLKMQEPCLKAIGLEMLYVLLALPEGREVAASDYDLRIEQLWDLSKMPIYADSQSMESALVDAANVSAKLRDAESELSQLRESMRQITSGRLWRLREKVHRILKR